MGGAECECGGGLYQQAQGNTPGFEQWAGLRWEGRATTVDRRKKCGGHRVKSRNERTGWGGGGGEHGRDSARGLGWKKSVG